MLSRSPSSARRWGKPEGKLIFKTFDIAVLYFLYRRVDAEAEADTDVDNKNKNGFLSVDDRRRRLSPPKKNAYPVYFQYSVMDINGLFRPPPHFCFFFIMQTSLFSFAILYHAT